jgi:hypothetical protein
MSVYGAEAVRIILGGTVVALFTLALSIRPMYACMHAYGIDANILLSKQFVGKQRLDHDITTSTTTTTTTTQLYPRCLPSFSKHPTLPAFSQSPCAP